MIQDSFSLAYLDRPFDFMKMDCEGCEGLLLGQPIPNVPCMIEVHTPQIMEGFSRLEGFRVVYKSPQAWLMARTRRR